MRSAYAALYLVSCLSYWGSSAWALSYVPMADDALLARADIVINGRVMDIAAPQGQELDETEYLIAVSGVIKGAVATLLRIRVPGALDPGVDGALIVPGAPRFAQSENLLLFLSQRSDGLYTPTQLVLGAFHYRESFEGEAVLDRDLSTAESLVDDDGVPRRYYRQARQFEQWLRDRAAGRSGDSAYWSAATSTRHSKFALTSPLGRWFEFEQGRSVPIYAGATGLIGLLGGGYSQLQEAIDAWNGASGRVALHYAGISSVVGGLNASDGMTQVLFNDPRDEISGSFDCSEGGVGAYGKWRGSATRLYQGQVYRVITEGDIVVQDGVGCLLGLLGKNNTQEILAHELGHVLGFDHSCGDAGMSPCTLGSLQDEALMRPTLHGDGRGASLNADDLAGLDFLYGDVANSSAASGGATSAGGNSGGGSPALSLLLSLAVIGLCRRRLRYSAPGH